MCTRNNEINGASSQWRASVWCVSVCEQMIDEIRSRQSEQEKSPAQYKSRARTRSIRPEVKRQRQNRSSFYFVFLCFPHFVLQSIERCASHSTEMNKLHCAYKFLSLPTHAPIESSDIKRARARARITKHNENFWSQTRMHRRKIKWKTHAKLQSLCARASTVGRTRIETAAAEPISGFS